MLLQRQKLFFDVMQKIDFLPSVVPGDGNCALWSILALMGGPVQKDPESLSHAEPSAKAWALRSLTDTWLLWT